MLEYSIVQPIGEGEFSQVFLAETPTGQPVVVKKFKANRAREARREYLLLASVDSPGVVRALGYEEAPEPCLLMEYVAGKAPHSSWISDESKREQLLAQAAWILAQVHARGICVNDIKAENIIVSEQDRLCFLDFGLATPNLFSDGQFRGTPSYAAPEKFLHKHNSFAADVFSLGIFAFYLEHGKTPADFFPQAEYVSLITDNKQWNHFLQEHIDDIELRKMLAFVGAERPTAGEVAQSLAERTGIQLANVESIQIENTVFSCQQQAVQSLIANNQLHCDWVDEPQRIAAMFSLWSETQETTAVILDEHMFLWQPESFWQTFAAHESLQANSETLIGWMQKQSQMRFLLYRNTPQRAALFDQMADLPNVFSLYIGKNSELATVSPEEKEQWLQSLSLQNLTETAPERPYLLRLWAKQQKGKKLKTLPESANEILALLDCLEMSVPLHFLLALDSRFQEWLPTLLQENQLYIQGDEVQLGAIATAESASENMLTRALTIAQTTDLSLLTGQLYFLLNRDEEAYQCWENHIEHLIKTGFYASAQEALQMLKSRSSNELSFGFRKKEAFLMRVNGAREAAITRYRELLESTSVPLTRAVLAVDMAVVLQETNRYAEAIEQYRAAAAIFKEQGKTKSLLRALNNLGTIHYLQDQFHQAEQAFQTVLELAEEHDDPAFQTFSLHNLAELFLRWGRWKRSLHFAQKAAEISRKFGKVQFQISAETIAVMNQLALGAQQPTSKLAWAIWQEPHVQENIALQQQIISSLLYLAAITDPQIEQQLWQAGLELEANDELLEMRFFFYWKKGQLLQASKQLEKLPHFSRIVMLQAIFDHDVKTIQQQLRKLAEREDVFTYCFYAMQLQLSEQFSEADLRYDIESFARIYEFKPLLELPQGANKQNVLPEKFSVFWEVLSQIHRNVKFRETMEAVLAGLIRIGKLERAIFFAFHDGELITELGLNESMQNLDLAKVQISQTILKETLQLGQIRFLTNLQEETTFDIHSSIFGLGLRSAVCFPLMLKGHIHGVIYADAKGTQEFSTDARNIIETILIQAQAALERSQLFEQLEQEQKETIATIPSFGEIIGNSAKMQEIFALMKTVGEHNVNVLIVGPTGSGKELIARALHGEFAPDKPFVAVNCAAIPETLLESELFGFKKGAFTGASQSKKGKIELAQNGTLFLDEIGDMPLALQAKLLRVIQERKLTPIGSEKEMDIEIRIIAATNQSLEKMVKDGAFREDLFYRLNVVRIAIPALMERTSDIPLLVHHFVEKFNTKFGKNVMGVSPEALRYLQNRSWKGNVRELENVMERAVLFCQRNEIDMDLFVDEEERSPFALAQNLPIDWQAFQQHKKHLVQILEQKYIVQLMREANDHIGRASQLGQLSRTQIYRLLKGTPETEK